MGQLRRKKDNYFYSCATNAGEALRERLAASPFLIRLKPFPDELFISFMARTAVIHLMDPVTFANFHYPEERNDFFNRDKDLSVSGATLEKSAYKCRVPVERMRQTTLSSYEGILWEKIYPTTRNRFVLNPMIRGRYARRNGIRFCPECLREEDYFRKRWRLSFSTVCPKHGCYLHECCPECGKPLTITKRMHDIQEFNCYGCGLVFRDAEAMPVHPESKAVENLRYIYDAMDSGWAVVDGRPMYALSWFIVLAQITKLIYNRGCRNHPLLQKEMDIAGLRSIDPPRKSSPVQDAPLIAHAAIYTAAVEILKSGENLKRYIRENHITPTNLLRDMGYVPFWYDEIVYGFMPRILTPCDAEIESAISYMKRHRMPLILRHLNILMGTYFDSGSRSDLFQGFMSRRDAYIANLGEYAKKKGGIKGY